MSKKVWWGLIFLGTTGVALGEELYASFDSSSNTMPWTQFIAAQPGWLIALETAVFFVWWPIHIYLAHQRRQQHVVELHTAAYVEGYRRGVADHMTGRVVYGDDEHRTIDVPPPLSGHGGSSGPTVAA